jgi:site-specific DNA-methyltransferase (adenine-specific)
MLDRLTDRWNDQGSGFGASSKRTSVVTKLLNSIHAGDCIKSLNELTQESVDLVFADPPFNIGFDYDVYQDDVDCNQYLDWSNRWIKAVYRALKPDGTFWLAIGDEYAAELKIASQKIGFHCRSWVVWYYTFGVNCAKKFTRSHAHLFYFVKDPEWFTFRDTDLENRVPSARELVYNDKRANPTGRLPDDTWIIRPADVVGNLMSDDDGTWTPSELVPPSDEARTFTLRPQDLSECFTPEEDTWYFPRVAGTFKERKGFHGCQMPEQLLGRIIRSCSKPGDLVVDPFSGSGTTLAVAKKLGRNFMGFELSTDYVTYGLERLDAIRVGDRLDGSAEPTKSAPKTGNKNSSKPLKKTKNKTFDFEAKEKRYDEIQLQLTLRGLVEAYALTHDGYSVDRVVADPELNCEFTTACSRLGLVGDPKTWNTLLFRLRKSGKLVEYPAVKRTTLTWEQHDDYMFASEIAWQSMIDSGEAVSLDEILCNPQLAEQFDQRAAQFAPGFKPIEYRWAALKLRKEAKFARGRAEVLTPPRFAEKFALDEFPLDSLQHESGLFVLSARDEQQLYAGETLDLRKRLALIIDRMDEWTTVSDSLFVEAVPLDHRPAGRLSWQTCVIRKRFTEKPKLNYAKLWSHED